MRQPVIFERTELFIPNDETYTENTNAENAVVKCKDGSQVTVCGTGTLNIESSYEGIEGAEVNIYSGDITINSTDDTINAANSDLTDYSFSINIMGGRIYAYTSEGDGIDSNGALNISGGTVEVWSANTADNQPLDADGTININGGTVLAGGGSSGMSASVSNGQPYIVIGSGAMGGGQPGQAPEQPGQAPEQPGQAPGQPGQPPEQPGQPGGGQSNVNIVSGSTVVIKDSDGNIIYKTAAKCNSSYIFFSSPASTDIEAYTDTGEISEWALTAMRWSVAEGMISGTSETSLSPKGVATRAQAALIIKNFVNAYTE